MGSAIVLQMHKVIENRIIIIITMKHLCLSLRVRFFKKIQDWILKSERIRK